jgi:hypothetical protein
MEFHVAVYNYKVISIKGEDQSAQGALRVPRGVWWEYKYEGRVKCRKGIMEHDFVYGYLSIGLVSLSLIVLLVLSGFALKMFCQFLSS